MTTYVYETIPSKPGQNTRYYEIKQTMSDQPLTQHPETGEPIRRVVLGGFGVLSSKPTSKPTNGSSGSSCGSGCGCH